MRKIPVQKNKEYIVEIIDNGFEGEGIAKIDGYTIFVNHAIKGEKCKILIIKVTTSHGYGRLLEIIDKAKVRQQSDCNTYQRCGGCSLRHIQYQETLNMKQKVVQNLIDKNLQNKVIVEKIIGMKKPLHYRNKAQYPVGIDKENNPVVGIYAKRTHDIIPMENCLIQSQISEIIVKNIVNIIKASKIAIYNEINRKRIHKTYCN